MPKGNVSACDEQCAADITAFMLQWPRYNPQIACEKAEHELKYGPRQMRLLTVDEYANSIEDLFDFQVDRSQLTSDSKVHNFSNRVKTAIDFTRLDGYAAVADQIIAFC